MRHRTQSDAFFLFFGAGFADGAAAGVGFSFSLISFGGENTAGGAKSGLFSSAPYGSAGGRVNVGAFVPTLTSTTKPFSASLYAGAFPTIVDLEDMTNLENKLSVGSG